MTVPRFNDLPLADRDRTWDGDAADARVRRWAAAEDAPNADYRRAHLWYDGGKPQNFGSYKLLIADVVDDKLVAVPRAITSAAGVMDGARGGADLPREDIPRIRRSLARYYRKMGDDPPWK